MGGSSSQVCWRQPWTVGAEALLRQSLAALGAPVEDLASQVWDHQTATIGGVRDYKLSMIGPAGPRWSSVLLHIDSLIGEPLAERISTLQDGPVFFFMEFDQTAWSYTLFRAGERLDHYWNDPDYVDESTDTCAGNSRVVAEACGVPTSVVEPYLVLRAAVRPESKAFADDEFTLDDHWVRVDFMRRVGIEYPDPSNQPHVFVKERTTFSQR